MLGYELVHHGEGRWNGVAILAKGEAPRRTRRQLPGDPDDAQARYIEFAKRTYPKDMTLDGLRVVIDTANGAAYKVAPTALWELGAEVIADSGPIADPDYPSRLVAEAGRIDVLLANLGIPAPTTAAQEATDDEWRYAFAHMADPLPRLARALLPQMIARGSGKLIVIGSASALRGIRRASTYRDRKSVV